MDDINFDLADQLGYKRPASPFRFKDFKMISDIAKELKQSEFINFIFNDLAYLFEITYLVYADRKIEKYEADYAFARTKGKIIKNEIAYYYLNDSNLYFVCACEYKKISGVKYESNNMEIPDEYMSHKQKQFYRKDNTGDLIKDNGLQADNRYLLTENVNDKTVIYVDGENKKVKTQKYIASAGEKIIIRIPNTINLNFRNNDFIYHSFDGTNRRYTNPDVFAGYVGVLFEVTNFKISSTGSCFIDGTCYPSVSHVNGVAFDIGLSEATKNKIKKNNKNPLSEEEVRLVKAFQKFHFDRLYIDNICISQLKSKGCNLNIIHIPNHQDHFHFDNFNYKIVRNMNKQIGRNIYQT